MQYRNRVPRLVAFRALRRIVLGFVIYSSAASGLGSVASADDLTESIMLLSFRESEQVRRTAQAVVFASPQEGLKAQLVQICERTRKSMDELSLPLMKDAVAHGHKDAAVADVFEKLASLQEVVYREISAAQAVVESDDKQSAARAFSDLDRKADDLYRQTATAIHQLSKGGAGAGHAERALSGGAQRVSPNPNPAAFSDEEWAAIVVELQRRGIVRDPKDANSFARILGLLKGVFVEKGIRDPSPKALFRLAKILLHDDGGRIASEKTEATFRQMLNMAKEMQMEVATKEQLLELNKKDE